MSAYQFPFTYRRPQPRQPMDERLPDGRSVDEAVTGVMDTGWGQQVRPQSPPVTTQPAMPAISIDPNRYGPLPERNPYADDVTTTDASAANQRPSWLSSAGSDVDRAYADDSASANTSAITDATPPAPQASTPKLSDLGKPPIMIDADRYGRPGNRAIGAESDTERDRALLDATRDYKPTKAGWKQKIWQIVSDFMQTGARTGDPIAAAGHALGSFGLQTAHPQLANEAWQRNREAELEGKVGKDISQENQQSLIEDRKDLTRSRQARDTRQAQHEKDWKANAAASQLEREYRSRPTYDPTDPGEVNDPNSLTNRAARAGISLGEKTPGVAGRVTDDQGYIWTYDRQGNISPLSTDDGTHLQDTTNIQRTQLMRARQKETERQNRFNNGIAQANLEVRRATEARIAQGGGKGDASAMGGVWTQKAADYRQKALDAQTQKKWEDYDYYTRLATHAAEQADNATAKAAGSASSSTTAAGSGNYKYTEADIRADNANRRAKGLTTMSADEAVTKARANKLIP